MSGGRALPFTLGHEIAGVIEARATQAEARRTPGRGLSVDRLRRLRGVPARRREPVRRPRHLGITVDGGYASHVAGPAPALSPRLRAALAALAAALMCSGLTSFAALKRLAAARRVARCCWSAWAASA